MPILYLRNQPTKSGVRVVAANEHHDKSVCRECGFITSYDPDLPHVTLLSMDQAAHASTRKGVVVVAQHYCGCQGF